MESTSTVDPISLLFVRPSRHRWVHLIVDSDTELLTTAELAAAGLPMPAKLRPSLYKKEFGDRVFKVITGAFALGVILIGVWIGLQSLGVAEPVFKTIGFWEFIKGTTWDPVSREFGALPFIYGTLVTSAIALVIAAPLGLGAALFLSELAPEWLRRITLPLVELLAAIPSVVYGLWGIFVLAPFMSTTVQPFLIEHFGESPFFKGYPLGVGMLTAGLILSVMVVPFVVSVSQEVIQTAPVPLREGMLALGATRWEVLRKVVLPYGRSGIFGAVILGLARALGETMAVTMVIGNTPKISASLLDPGYTMATVIANEFTEATYDYYISALVAIAFILFIITIIVNGAARLLIWRVSGSLQRSAR